MTKSQLIAEIKLLCERHNHAGCDPGTHALANKILTLAEPEAEREFR